jgi:ABC-type multidrug transport system permease subunit
MNTPDKFLLHSIDAATLKGSRNRSSGLGGTVFVLAITLVFCALALYKDGVFA